MMNRYKVFQNVSCYAFKSKKECSDLIKKIYLQNKGFYSIAINAEKLIRKAKAITPKIENTANEYLSDLYIIKGERLIMLKLIF